MLDLFSFIVSQFYNIIMFLDNIVIYNSLTLLKVFIIILIFKFMWKFLHNKKGD